MLTLALWIITATNCVPELCEVDFTCQAPTPYCFVGLCVECTKDAECTNGAQCISYQCVNGEAPVPDGGPDRAPDAALGDTPPNDLTPIDPGGPKDAGEVAALPDGKEPAIPDPNRPDDRTPPEPRIPDPPAPDKPICNNGQTRPCYTGSQGCQQNGGSFTCTAPCKAGTQTCVNNAWAKACQGQTLPGFDRCDNVDRDCDGKPDPCRSIEVVPNIVDYAVNNKGVLVSVSSTDTNKGLKAHCFANLGAAPKSLTLVTPGAPFVGSARVIPLSNGNFLVAWVASIFNMTLQATMSLKIMTPQCTLLPTPSLTLNDTNNFDIAIDGSGRIAIAQNSFTTAKLLFYDASLKKLKETTMSTSTQADGCWFLTKLVVNSKGQGLFACNSRNQQAKYPLRIRRFEMPSKVDASFLTVPNSAFATTFVGEMYQFVLGINEKNDIVVQYQNTTANKCYAYFRTAAGQVANPVIHTRIGRGKLQTPRPTNATPMFAHSKAEVVGDDFILQDLPQNYLSSHIWYRYTPAGTRVKTLTLKAAPTSIRKTGNNFYFVLPTSHFAFVAPNPF